MPGRLPRKNHVPLPHGSRRGGPRLTPWANGCRTSGAVAWKLYLPTPHPLFITPRVRWIAKKYLKTQSASLRSRTLCALSSVVEHYLHTVGVAGSKPAVRTISPLFFNPPVTPPNLIVLVGTSIFGGPWREHLQGNAARESGFCSEGVVLHQLSSGFSLGRAIPIPLEIVLFRSVSHERRVAS